MRKQKKDVFLEDILARAPEGRVLWVHWGSGHPERHPERDTLENRERHPERVRDTENQKRMHDILHLEPREVELERFSCSAVCRAVVVMSVLLPLACLLQIVHLGLMIFESCLLTQNTKMFFSSGASYVGEECAEYVALTLPLP